jgi:hypothetical protein
MPERLEDECGIPHIVSDAVPCTVLYDMCIVLITHATNMQILMGDPDCHPYYKSLQAVHEDLVWLLGILQIAYGITPGEVIEYSNRRKAEGAFQPGPEKEERRQGKIPDECHERMYG